MRKFRYLMIPRDYYYFFRCNNNWYSLKTAIFFKYILKYSGMKLYGFALK